MSHCFHFVAGVVRQPRHSSFAFWNTLLFMCLVVGCADGPSTGPALQPTAQSRKPVPRPAVQILPATEPTPLSTDPAAAATAPGTIVDEAAQPESSNSAEPTQPRRIIGKTTQDVRDAQKEESKGARKVQPRITGQDPITVTGNAYSAIVGRAELLQIKHSIDLFYNLNGRYPKDLQEFMKEIIHANRIRLAQLPFYQEYGYDAAKHELVILEYPDKKAQVPGGGR